MMTLKHTLIATWATWAILSLALACSACGGRGASEVEWQKTFGGTGQDHGNSVRQTSDGGHIIAGSTSSFGAGLSDVWLIKTDEKGNRQWDRIFGGTDQDFGNLAQQTTDGGYIIAGSTSSFGAGQSDVWLIKTDAEGNEQWNKTFGGTGDDVAYCAEQTADGGYVLAGDTTSYGVGYYDAWLIKTDSSGDKEWDKIFDGFAANSVQQTSDAGYIVVGQTNYSGASTSGPDVWLMKTDSSGDKEWEKTFGSLRKWQRGNAVQQTSDSGYIIVGSTAWAAGEKYSDLLLIKTDSDGNLGWERTFGDADYYDDGRSVQQTPDEGYVIAGARVHQGTDGCHGCWLMKTDSDGNRDWERTFDGFSASSFQQTSEGAYVIVGDRSGTVGDKSGTSDVWLTKLRAGEDR